MITLKEAIDDCRSRSTCYDGQEGKYYHAWKILYSFAMDEDVKEVIRASAEKHREALERLSKR